MAGAKQATFGLAVPQHVALSGASPDTAELGEALERVTTLERDHRS